MTALAPLRLSLCSVVLLSVTVPAAAQMLPGDLLLNSYNNPNLLAHYRPDGTVVQTSGTGTGLFWKGAAILPNGNWVTSRTHTNGVNIFDGVTGAEIATGDIPGFSGSPGDVGAFSDGSFAVVELTGWVWRLDSATNVIAFWKVSPHPFGILVDDQDHVWTCDVSSGVLWHTDDQGHKINEFSIGESAGDVAMAKDGTLFVTRRNSGEVAHYTRDGSFLGAFKATGIKQITGIAVGSDQTLWVSGEKKIQIRNFDQTGNFLGSIDVGPAKHPVFLTIYAPFRYDIGTNYCGPANFNSTGQSAVISASGSTKASYNFVTLTAAKLPPNVFGYFLNSDVQGFTPFPPGSNGNLCLGGGIGRHARQIANSGPAGELVIDVDLKVLPRPGGPHSVIAGETWNFQCWFRDNHAGSTSNFTDAVSVLFE